MGRVSFRTRKHRRCTENRPFKNDEHRKLAAPRASASSSGRDRRVLGRSPGSLLRGSPLLPLPLLLPRSCSVKYINSILKKKGIPERSHPRVSQFPPVLMSGALEYEVTSRKWLLERCMDTRLRMRVYLVPCPLCVCDHPVKTQGRSVPRLPHATLSEPQPPSFPLFLIQGSR